MVECQRHDVCGLSDKADPNARLCILHSKNPDKDIQEFLDALDIHYKDKGCDFRWIFFPTLLMTDFRDTTFSGVADFRDTTFSNIADFSRATFSDEACFNNATFSDEVYFNNAMFLKEAKFVGT